MPCTIAKYNNVHRINYQAEMKVFIIHINGVPADKAYTSLLGACEEAGVSYQSACNKRKRVWRNDVGVVCIFECEVVQIKGRGKVSF